MGRAAAREVQGSWGIHSTLTAWSLWPSSCPRGGPPGLWGLGLPWLRGLWSLVSAAACKTLSGCRDAGMRGAGKTRPSSRPRVSGRRRENHAKEKGLVTIVKLTYIKPCVYSEDIDGRDTCCHRPHVSEKAQSLGCGPLAASSALSLPRAFWNCFFASLPLSLNLDVGTELGAWFV